MAKYRSAMIGCGGRSHAHLKAYELVAEAEAVACCDLDEARASERADEFNLRPYTDARAMIEAEKPDMVHIATRPDVRVELLGLVAEMDVPMATVEKPLAVGVADWKAMRQLEARTSTKIAVCHQLRWQQHLVKCQQAVASGKLGDVKFLDFSAGMNISGQGTHILNYGMSLNGNSPVIRVFGAASGKQQADTTHPAPDDTAGYLTFANGVRGLWNNGSAALRSGDPETVWQHVRAAAYCDNGRVNFEEFGKWEIVSPDGVAAGTCEDDGGWNLNNLRAQAGLYEAVIAWHETGDAGKCGTNFKQSLHEWAVVLALYQSALERRIVEMAEFDPPEDLFAKLLAAL